MKPLSKFNMKPEKYVVVFNGVIVRGSDRVQTAKDAINLLKPDNKNGEVLYLRVGGQKVK